ncbi:dsRBD fold-containing protein [Streptomyces sp. A475]|uniref:dsRBD fold-containing protein n=1 Tax=Streptomyces sp. A475 TaxID=3131976 RepID=UPI0030C978F7
MPHTAEWKIHLYVVEEDRTTKARLELDTGTARLTGHGHARRNPEDSDVPEIGDDLAVSRAMENMAGQLKATAYSDMRAVGADPNPKDDLRPYRGWLDTDAS